MSSIRFRIISVLLLSLVIINSISGFYLYRHVQHEVEEVFNAQQAQTARTIDQLLSELGFTDPQTLATSKVPDVQEPANTYTLGHHYEKKIAYQIWDLQGNLLLMSENAPLYPLAAMAPGFSRNDYVGDSWYIFSLYSNATEKWIFTAQKAETRNELIELITFDQLITMLLVNVLLLLVVVPGVILGTRPITRLSREIAQRDGNQLAPITTPVSQELQPIREGINRLLERIQNKISQEKSFSADISHELRTPLAAIKVHAQNLEIRESLSDEGQLALERMSLSVDSMSNMVEQLLLLNRIENMQQTMVQESVPLLETARDVLAFLPPDYHRHTEYQLQGQEVHIAGSRALIKALFRNLIDNASRYSGDDAEVDVFVGLSGADAFIEVQDNGPGLTDKQKRNAIERHYRVSDCQRYGSGIGLSIVKKIVDLHEGNIVLTNVAQGPGLSVKVVLKTV